MFNLSSRAAPRSLGAWLALAFSLLSIVLTVVLVEVVERAATKQVKIDIGHGLGELAMQTADKLDHGMFERYREVSLLAQRSDLQGANRTEQRRILSGVQDTYGFYDWIGMAGLDGKVQVAGHGLLEGADVSQRQWFRKAQQGVHVGDVHEAKLLATLLPSAPNGEPRRFVDVAFPYFDKDGKPAGVLGTHLSWRWAREVERSIMRPVAARGPAEAMIVGANGLVLLGPPGLQGTTLKQPSFQFSQRQNNGYLLEKWSDGNSYLVGFARTKGYGNYPGLGWTVLVRQNADNAYLPVQKLRDQALDIGIGLALLFSLAGVLIARGITRPLGMLARSAQRIQHGEAVPIAPVADSYFEVRALSSSLNALVADLMERRHQLMQLNATLEQRVEERTGELEQALLKVQAGKQRIRSIIEASQDAFIGIDLQGKITDWNSQAQAMFGWRREEAVGRPLVELVVPERFRASVARAFAIFNETRHSDALEQRLERIVVNRQGVEFPIEMTASLAGTTENAFFSVFLHDISERKKIERMKDEFVATVSHELRTPLTSIRASLSMLADGMAGELPADVKALVGIAGESCERLVRLVSDVLDIQKIESGNMELALVGQPLLPLLDRSLAAMRAYACENGVALRQQCEPGAAALAARVDRDRLAQVLANLLSNAIKFSELGGAVTMRLARHGEQARILVIDSGCGIPDEFRPRMFQRFAQADSADSRKKGGTGLGLSICKSIVEEHGGTIGYDSEPGCGTSFHVDLPLAPAAVSLKAGIPSKAGA